MKHTIPWLAFLLTVTSTGFALGCGCHTRLAPVRERLMCPAPVASHRTVYVPECRNCRWIPPSTNNPAYVIGSIVTAPFRLLTGRELGQPDVVASRDFVRMTPGKLVTVTRTKPCYNACGEMTGKMTTKSTMLEPVGERITTVKVIRTKPMPMHERCYLGNAGTGYSAPSPGLPPVAEGYRQELLPNHPVLWY